MIFAYYDENGILKETITKPVRVGDDGYDKVYLFFAGKDYDSSINAYPSNVAEGSEITSTFRNSADGVGSVEEFDVEEPEQIPFDPERDLKYFRYYTNYQFYVAIVPTSVLATSGTVSCTPRQIYADSHARAYGTLIFPVEGGVVIGDSAITISQYDYLLSIISPPGQSFYGDSFNVVEGLEKIVYMDGNGVHFDDGEGGYHDIGTYDDGIGTQSRFYASEIMLDGAKINRITVPDPDDPDEETFALLSDLETPSQSVAYLTTAPTEANTNGGLILVVLTEEPATKYDGYYYIITEE